MRYLISFFFIFFGFTSSAQSEDYLQVQGGYLIDRQFNADYSGFQILNLSYVQLKDRRRSSFELELVGYEDLIQPSGGDTIFIESSIITRRSAELIYAHTQFTSKFRQRGFFYGPMASINLNTYTTESQLSVSFPRINRCICFGLGAKFGFDWPITESIALSLSSRITVLSLGIDRQFVDNPNLLPNLRVSSGFGFDFVRPSIPFLLGVRFKI